MQGQVRARRGDRNGQHKGQGQGEQWEVVSGSYVCWGVINPDNSNDATGQGPWKPGRGLGFDVSGTGRHSGEEGGTDTYKETLEEDWRS